MKTPPDNDLSRRAFVRLSALGAGAATLANLSIPRAKGAIVGSDRLRIGLIGCGRRGCNAVKDCLDSAPGVEIVALADLFKPQVEVARAKYHVSPERCFWGFDAYRRLLATEVDLVILATPPGFRPMHFDAAITAGKHVFMEKPVAVDPAGCRAVIETSKRATAKRLAVVAGTQYRHERAYVETMTRIHDGALGELLCGQCYWMGTGIWFREKKDWLAGLSDFEWQCWNWYHWDWLSGDQIVEQHIHQIDVMNWAFGGPPAKFLGLGGRQSRGAIPGNIWDHFSVELEYPNGARVLSMCRHAPRSTERVGQRVVGAKGVSDCGGTIKGEKPFSYSGPNPSPQVQEHADLIASIRAGNPLNEGERIAISTLTAIGGRISAYTGREISWNWLLNSSRLDIFPKECRPGPGVFPPIPAPGTTPLI